MSKSSDVRSAYADGEGNDDLRVALADVRRAYRLLQQYQRRILDLAGEFTLTLDKDLQYRYWRPSRYWSPPRRQQDPTGRWAWDGLPYYDFYLVYCTDAHWASLHKPGHSLVALRFVADDGFEPSASEPDPISFLPSEEANSLLAVYRYQYMQTKAETWESSAFERGDWPAGDSPVILEGYMLADCTPIPLSQLGSPSQIMKFAEEVRQKPLIAPVDTY